MSRPSEVGFENLSHVHTGGDAQRIQNDLDRRAVVEVRHVLFWQNPRNDTLVTVTAGHFVANAQLALHRDVDFDQLDHARRQFVALGQLVFSLVDNLLENVDLTRGHFFDLVDLLVDPRIFIRIFDALQVAGRNTLDGVAIENRVLGEQALVGALVVQVGLHHFAAQDVVQPLETLVGQNSDFVRKVPFELANLRRLDGFGAFVFLLTLAGENFHVDNYTFDTGRAVQRSVANVSGFFTEDGAQQLLFWRELSFTLGRYFANQNVALLDAGADANDASFVQIAQHGLADVGNIARDFFRSKLGVARFKFVLLDVHRGVVIVVDQFFRDQDCVFEVVSAPRHERDQHVAAKGQLPVIGAGAVRDYLAFGYALALDHDRLLVDASVLVGTL